MATLKPYLLDDGMSLDLDDDEVDAGAIEDWLEVRDFDPQPIVPGSARFMELDWAHENDEAWPMVDLPDGLDVDQARALMVAAVEEQADDFAEVLRSGLPEDDEARKNPYHQKDGKFGFRPTPNLAAPHPTTTRNPAAVAKMRVAKARKAEPGLTDYTGKLAKRHGGKQAFLDFRLKTEKSLARKIGNDVRDGKGKVTSEEIAERMFDVNRYTTVFSHEGYAAGSQATLDDIRRDGHTVKVKNYWTNPDVPYQGVNVQITSKEGINWELQFHTDVSLDVKESKAHAVYEKLRVETNPQKMAEYNDELSQIFAEIPVPPGVFDVG